MFKVIRVNGPIKKHEHDVRQYQTIITFMSVSYDNTSLNRLNFNKQINNISYAEKMFDEDILYCKISIIMPNQIAVEFHNSNMSEAKVSKKLQVIFKSNNVENLIFLIKSHIYISSKLSVGHALYIGCELTKAQLALITTQNYIQN
uniref:DUF4346 domain-containing protein n=1 Tax=Helminthora furcellata TaxID=1884666 RepID=A0A1G4NZ80_9FLOR|nr:Hypothetical protein ORF_1 [Helminthora furcellata]SCW21108.1 Hypothetical protein ORF_1 [Helminthora furcellata]SCW23968.1 Hypothetical protein ORF_1 [Helminthora furcellata]